MGGPLNADPDGEDFTPPTAPGTAQEDGAAVVEGPPVNPPSHGDPTNPAQPKS